MMTDSGRKCECENEGILDPDYADLYDAETELPYVNHKPGECRCTNELAQYRTSGGVIRWLCSCCHTFGNERLAPTTQKGSDNAQPT